MKKSKKILLSCIALLFLAVCVAAGTTVGVLVGRDVVAKQGVREKILYTVNMPWSDYTLQQAAQNAKIILVGKVTSKGSPGCYVALYTSGTFPIYYQNVKVRTEQALKGEPEDIVIYQELGGETPDAVYEFVGRPTSSF